ncbi:TadE/TadG family type IV pilus assembly protein [Tsuneonella sp. HG222]
MMARFLPRILRDSSGSTAVEFALLAPVLIGSLIAILHVGTGMQNYNAMRSVSADVARYTVVEFANGGTVPTNDEIGTWGTTQATGPAYKLRGGTVVVTNAATQRVGGAVEKTIVVTATMPTLFDEMGLKGFTMTYSRPVFVTS